MCIRDSQGSSHTAIRYIGSGFKAVWSGVGFTQQMAAQNLLKYLTGQSFVSSETYYRFPSNVTLFYPTSPYNQAGTMYIGVASQAKYFVDGIETVVQVDGLDAVLGDIAAGPRSANFIYQR